MHTLSDLPADAPVSSGADTPCAAAPPRTLAPSFTGDGKEYFRIWVVNLLLTLATFGIYSAWAKVRPALAASQSRQPSRSRMGLSARASAWKPGIQPSSGRIGAPRPPRTQSQRKKK